MRWIRGSLVLLALIFALGVFWCTQSLPLMPFGIRDQNIMVVFQGFFHLRYVTSMYSFVCLTALYFLMPDVKIHIVTRFCSRTRFFACRILLTLIYCVVFSITLCGIVLMGTFLFYDRNNVDWSLFQLGLMLQTVQFTLLYGTIVNCFFVIQDWFERTWGSILLTVVIFFLLTYIFGMQLNIGFFFTDIDILLQILEQQQVTVYITNRMIRMAGMYMLSGLLSYCRFLRRDFLRG